MEKEKLLRREKSDYKDLGAYLSKHDLIDDRSIWFAGYDDSIRGSRHAVSANVFYGNKRLLVVSVKDDNFYLLRNSKEGFILYHLGNLKDKNKVRSHFTLVWPSIEIHTVDGDELALQVTMNKKQVKTFKKLF
jgi:hypothetical protein